MTHAYEKNNVEIDVCKLWECRNAYCPNYTGRNVRLGITELEWDVFGQHACRRCGGYVREVRTREHPAKTTLFCVALGALLGFWGGVTLSGSALGGIVGLLLWLLTEPRRS